MAQRKKQDSEETKKGPADSEYWEWFAPGAAELEQFVQRAKLPGAALADVHPAKRRPGRRPTPMPEKLRAWVWYTEVHARTHLTDYALDGLVSTRKGADRDRVFERIKLRGALPSSGAGQMPGISLGKEIEAYRDDEGGQPFAGTLPLLDSPFWHLLSDQRLDLACTRNIISKCLLLNGLQRITGKSRDFLDLQLIGTEIKAGPGVPSTLLQRYLFVLEQAMERIHRPLDRAGLVGALFREAHLLSILDLSFCLAEKFREELQRLWEFHWMQNYGQDLIDYSIRQVLYREIGAHLDRTGGGLPSFETVVGFIVPKE
ncbi:hypothetical protein DXT74_17340 [Chromobacterium sp. Rain0013]|nr:hypothetical protein DXT74_17340 [Chromobacterium sp. Rain0013]